MGKENEMLNESDFDKEFEIVLTKEDFMMYYGAYSQEDIDRID